MDTTYMLYCQEVRCGRYVIPFLTNLLKEADEERLRLLVKIAWAVVR